MQSPSRHSESLRDPQFSPEILNQNDNFSSFNYTDQILSQQHFQEVEQTNEQNQDQNNINIRNERKINLKRLQFQNKNSHQETSSGSNDYRNPQDPEIIDNEETNPYIQQNRLRSSREQYPSDAKTEPKDYDSKNVNEKAQKLQIQLIEREFFKHYDKSVINFVFVVVFLSNIFINIDHGTLPACATLIKEELDMNDFQFGILGSLVYAGITIGSVVASGVFQKSNLIKPALALSLFMNSVSLVMFTLSPYFYLDAILRLFIGIFQVFATIYMPVWADIFAKERRKSAWLTFLILAAPLGLVIGFAMTSALIAFESWRLSFYIQAIGLIPCVIAFLLIPQKYIDIESASKFKDQCALQAKKNLENSLKILKKDNSKDSQQQLNEEKQENNGMNFFEQLSPLKEDANDQEQERKFEEYSKFLEAYEQNLYKQNKNFNNQLMVRERALKKIEKIIKNEQKDRRFSLNTNKVIGSTSKQDSRKEFIKRMKSILSNKVFVSLILALTLLYFTVTGIQYWTMNYLVKVFPSVSQAQRDFYFTVTSFTAPVGGVVVGGIITSKLGGYNTKKAQKVQCLVSIIAAFCAIPIPFLDQFQAFVGLLWLVLFCGGFCLPPVTGIMINSVPSHQKSSANAIANLCYNLLGYLPAPSVFGIISQISQNNGNTEQNAQRYAMGTILYAVCATSLVLMYGIYHKIKIEDQRSQFSVSAKDEDSGESPIFLKEDENDVKIAMIEQQN